VFPISGLIRQPENGGIIRGAMRYRVICRVNCARCSAGRVIDDPDVKANDKQEAIAAFKEKHKLCKVCLAEGTNAEVSFDSFVYADLLPSFGVEGF